VSLHVVILLITPTAKQSPLPVLDALLLLMLKSFCPTKVLTTTH
jgi:hypothetical protein